MAENERILAQSYRGFGTLLLAAVFLGVAMVLVWSLVAGKGRISFGETPLLAVAVGVITALVAYSGFNLLDEKVVVTSRCLMVRSNLRWRSVHWCQVDEIGAALAISGRLMIVVRYRDGSRRRWLSFIYLGFQGGYRDVLRALLVVAASKEHLGRMKVSKWIVEEAG